MEQASPDTFESLAEEIITLCANIHGAECRLIERIRRLDDLQPWRGEMPERSHWLNLHCGRDLVTAGGPSVKFGDWRALPRKRALRAEWMSEPVDPAHRQRMTRWGSAPIPPRGPP